MSDVKEKAEGRKTGDDEGGGCVSAYMHEAEDATMSVHDTMINCARSHHPKPKIAEF
jgi:hypothetical protein